jgi:hypothetical protein
MTNIKKLILEEMKSIIDEADSEEEKELLEKECAETNKILNDFYKKTKLW